MTNEDETKDGPAPGARRTRAVVWGAALAVAAAVATGVAVAVVNTGDAGAVISQRAVADALAADASPQAAATSAQVDATSAAPGTTAAVTSHSARVPGGYVRAECVDGLAHLTQWSPLPEYRSDKVVAGPAKVASVWFESDSHADVAVVVSCSARGKPMVDSWMVADDHGGGKGGDHPDAN